MNPEHPIFSTSEFDDDMDYLSDAEDSLNDANQAVLYRETRRHISQLKVLISQSESGSLVVAEDSSAISITDQDILSLRGGGDGDSEDSWYGERCDNQGNEVGESEEGKICQAKDNDATIEESASTGLGLLLVGCYRKKIDLQKSTLPLKGR
jgi:hypothetical protein